MNYLQLSNAVLRSLNEVELTSANFASSRGIQTAVKDFINRSINDIYTAELEWPFLHADGTITTVAGTAEYSLVSGYKSVDVNSFYLIESETDIKVISFIPYIQFAQQFRERDLDPTTTTNRGKPDFIYLTNDDKVGFTPIPDKEYTVYYEYYQTHTDLSSTTDEPLLPTRYQDTIVARSEYYVNQLRADINAASMKDKEYKERIERMRIDLINKPDYMRSPIKNSGGQQVSKHPKYF